MAKNDKLTYDFRKHYSVVLRQQGRVLLDDDWNETIQLVLDLPVDVHNRLNKMALSENTSISELAKNLVITGLDLMQEEISKYKIQYLAKEFADFRAVMMEFLRANMSEWTKNEETDLDTMLLELLAQAADELSYYQDLIASEAYLETARKRKGRAKHVSNKNLILKAENVQNASNIIVETLNDLKSKLELLENSKTIFKK